VGVGGRDYGVRGGGEWWLGWVGDMGICSARMDYGGALGAWVDIGSGRPGSRGRVIGGNSACERACVDRGPAGVNRWFAARVRKRALLSRGA